MGPFDVPQTFLQMFWKTLLYILHHSPPCHIYICRCPHFFQHRILVLGATRRFLMVTPSLKWTSGAIYKFKCPHINCPKECTGESGRTFWDRLKNISRPFPDPPTQQLHRTPSQPKLFDHCSQGFGESQEISRRPCTCMYMTLH